MNNIETEAYMYYTVNDAKDVIDSIGMRDFLTMLFKESKGRALTIEEIEAMEKLHEGWNL
jgi:hypothetical protein